MISMFVFSDFCTGQGMARMVRGQVLPLNRNEYVLAAKIGGANQEGSSADIILPNCVSVIIVAGSSSDSVSNFTERVS